MYKIIIILAVSISLSSCVSLPVYQSIKESGFNEETIYSGYDSGSRLRWLVSNDSLNLYIRIDTDNPATIKKIVNLGMKIIIDTTSKRKDGMFLNYPIFQTSQLSRKDKDQMRSQFNNSNQRTEKLGLMLQKTSSTIRYVKADEIHIFNAYDKDADVVVKLEADDKGNMQYFAKIPFELISNRKLNTFSLGINIDAFEIDMQQQKGQGENSGSSFGAGGGGGGAHGRGQGKQGGQGGGSFKRPELAQSVDIWFKVNLN